MSGNQTQARPQEATAILSDFKRSALFEKLFPEADCRLKPFGAGVLVQVASPLDRIGNVLTTTETQEFQMWNQRLAKVIKLGPVAFRDRNTMEPWPEGAWAKPGDYVRVRQYVGDRVVMDLPDGKKALFAVTTDRELQSGYEDDFDPLAVRGWV